MNEQTNPIPFEKWPWWVKLFALTSGRILRPRTLLFFIIGIQLTVGLLGYSDRPGKGYDGYHVVQLMLLVQLSALLWIVEHSSVHLLVAARTTQRLVISYLFLVALFVVSIWAVPYLMSLF